MQLFSQRDVRWVNKPLGISRLIIGRFGCTITCIAMLSTYFGDNYTPYDISKICKFTPNGLVIWTTAKFSRFRFDWREYGRNDAGIMRALKDPHRAVILEVANKSHWVVATGKPLIGSQYKIADPFFGDRSTMARYGNNITGAAYFRRT